MVEARPRAMSLCVLCRLTAEERESAQPGSAFCAVTLVTRTRDVVGGALVRAHTRHRGRAGGAHPRHRRHPAPAPVGGRPRRTSSTQRHPAAA